jgi:hypothetical protein
MKKSDPWLLAFSLLGVGLMYSKWSGDWFGSALRGLDATAIRKQIGTEWMVTLKDGKRVVMNNLQLANAIESRGVKTYQKLS